MLTADNIAINAIQSAKWAAKKTIRAREVEQLAAKFPQLTLVSTMNGNGLIAATKNIRTELKAAFPGVKFSVTSSRYSGGDSIRVSWTDGPCADRVEAITKKYQAGSFDGMQDLYTYDDDAFNDAFGDARYVHTTRSYSPKIEQWINEQVAKHGYNNYWNNPHRILSQMNIKAIK